MVYFLKADTHVHNNTQWMQLLSTAHIVIVHFISSNITGTQTHLARLSKTDYPKPTLRPNFFIFVGKVEHKFPSLPSNMNQQADLSGGLEHQEEGGGGR